MSFSSDEEIEEFLSDDGNNKANKHKGFIKSI